MKAQHTRVAHVVITCTERIQAIPFCAHARADIKHEPRRRNKASPTQLETTPAPANTCCSKATAFANHCQHAQTLPISANALRTQPVAIDGKT